MEVETIEQRERQVTLTHLAQHLGVHPTTISMALRGHPRISAATRERVEALAERWHYAPNHIARSLRRRSTKTLGVLFPYVTLPYYATMLDAIDLEADRRGLHLEVHFHQWSSQQETSAIRTLVERRADGMILLPSTLTPGETLRACVRPTSDIPVSIIGGVTEPNLPSFVRGFVEVDLRAGSALLGEHLLQMGHRRIALLLPERASAIAPHTFAPAMMQRIEGLRSALGKWRGSELLLVQPSLCASGVEGAQQVRMNGIGPDYNFALCRELAEEFGRLSPRPTAVVTTDEVTAQLLLAELTARGLRVPADVSVACYDGTFLSACGTVPLTCVAQPFDLLAQHLIDLVSSDRAKSVSGECEVRSLLPTLVPRASVARIQEDTLSISQGSEDNGRSSGFGEIRSDASRMYSVSAGERTTSKVNRNSYTNTER